MKFNWFSKIIILMLLILILNRFFYILFIKIYFGEKSKYYPVEMSRQIILKSICNIEPSIKVDKYIYDKTKSIIGAIHDSTLILIGANGTELYHIALICKISKKSFYNYKVHEGALELFNYIKPQIQNYYINTIYGYSLGAMVATLVMYDIFKTKNVRCKGYLIGNPPIGEKQFTIEFNKQLPDVSYVCHPMDYIANPFYMKEVAFLDYYKVGHVIKKYKYNNKGIVRLLFPHIQYV